MIAFEEQHDSTKNLLPYDGSVHYYGTIIPSAQADHYLDLLLHEIKWEQDRAVLYGKEIITKRKVAWYGDEAFHYTYSNTTKEALPWTAVLLALKNKIEAETGETFNSCLLNLYHSGEEGMAWHSDAEKDLQKDGAIASLTFGAARKFAFKHKVNGNKVELILTHGSLLVMKGQTQRHWLHRLPPTKKVSMPRVNLTFRRIAVPQPASNTIKGA